MDQQPSNLKVSRIFDAPVDLIWQAFTNPRHIGQWWGPKGFSCSTVEIDIQPGGVWRFTMQNANGKAFQNRLQFKELIHHQLIAYTCDDDGMNKFAPFDVVVTFKPIEERTHITLDNQFASAQTRQRMQEHGAESGGLATLSCLEHYLNILLYGEAPPPNKLYIVQD